MTQWYKGFSIRDIQKAPEAQLSKNTVGEVVDIVLHHQDGLLQIPVTTADDSYIGQLVLIRDGRKLVVYFALRRTQNSYFLTDAMYAEEFIESLRAQREASDFVTQFENGTDPGEFVQALRLILLESTDKRRMQLFWSLDAFLRWIPEDAKRRVRRRKLTQYQARTARR